MMPSNNPTAMSAVIGEEIVLAGTEGRRGDLLKALVMPALLLAFAGYLGVGMITMRVPEGTAFPGPRFFPGLIALGLTICALLLIVAAIRTALRPALDADAAADDAGAGAGALGTGAGALGAGAGALGTGPGALGAEVGALDTGLADDALGTPVPSKTVRLDWRSLAWVVGSFLAFALLLPTLGWIIGAALLFWCVARGFGAQRPLASLVVGLTMSSIVYIAFDMLLGMSLPAGILAWGF